MQIYQVEVFSLKISRKQATYQGWPSLWFQPYHQQLS